MVLNYEDIWKIELNTKGGQFQYSGLLASACNIVLILQTLKSDIPYDYKNKLVKEDNDNLMILAGAEEVTTSISRLFLSSCKKSAVLILCIIRAFYSEATIF